MAQEVETHCRIGTIRLKEAGRQDPEFMRWMHDRLLRPPFVSAAAYWQGFLANQRVNDECPLQKT